MDDITPMPTDPNNKKNIFFRFLDWIDGYFKRNALYVWTTVWILLIILFGLVAIYMYTAKLDTNYAIIVVWALALFFLGGLMGCIFGVPKGVTKPQIQSPAAAINPPGGVQPVTPEDPNAMISTTATISYNKGNTNLTDISDWLTKIVIGAGLVQLHQIPGFILKVAGKMATGIHIYGVPNSQILCAGIILYYLCFGLIAGYFVMRSILLNLINN